MEPFVTSTWGPHERSLRFVWFSEPRGAFAGTLLLSARRASPGAPHLRDVWVVVVGGKVLVGGYG